MLDSFDQEVKRVFWRRWAHSGWVLGLVSRLLLTGKCVIPFERYSGILIITTIPVHCTAFLVSVSRTEGLERKNPSPRAIAELFILNKAEGGLWQ